MEIERMKLNEIEVKAYHITGIPTDINKDKVFIYWTNDGMPIYKDRQNSLSEQKSSDLDEVSN